MYTVTPDGDLLLLNMSPGGLRVEYGRTSEILSEGYGGIHGYIEAILAPTAVLPVLSEVYETVPLSRVAPFTCVELVRSVLGIDDWIFTPRALFEYLVDRRIVAALMT